MKFQKNLHMWWKRCILITRLRESKETILECFSRIVFFLFRVKIYESWECVMDKIDKKLITLLQQDARMPLKALAENVFCHLRQYLQELKGLKRADYRGIWGQSQPVKTWISYYSFYKSWSCTCSETGFLSIHQVVS